MRVVVFGLGKIGLPLAVQCAHAGHTVLGVDINAALVAQINAGDNPYMHEPDLNERLTAVLRLGNLRATTDAAGAVQQAEVILVIVPVKLSPNKRPDLATILAATTQIGQHLRPGTLISYETTLPVGTTRHVLVPRLEMFSGLDCGVDFHAVFSPERVKSTSIFRKLHETPKIVGGFSPTCTQHGIHFYASSFGSQIINAETLEAAELAKLAGMLYRDVNIALVNQLAIYAMARHVDLHKVIEWANTDGESMLLQPGIGVGGHCTPIYPYFLIQDAEACSLDLSLAKEARRVNDTMMASILEIANLQVAGQRVLILGLSFRPDIKEDTASPTYNISEYLHRLGAQAYVHDPFYTSEELRARGLRPACLSNGTQYDMAILTTFHHSYQAISPNTLKHMGIRLLIDGRNGFDPNTIAAAGIEYIGIGRGGAA
jgi:nucleotide sugar dehydrogenase